VAEALGKTDIAEDYSEADELLEIHVCIWFCQGRIIKFAEHPLDTEETLYSLCYWQEDPNSIWGLGVPHCSRDTCSAANAAWRMIMDGGGLSAGPQVAVDKRYLEPEDGSWALRPFKEWNIKESIPDGHKPLQVFHIDTKIAELMSIIQACMSFIEEETGVTKLAQGEQGANVTKTAQGMAMLMNSTNTVFRRVVRLFDDTFTKPNIRRMYAWAMQWSDDPEIKGDFEVDARGSSVLLVQEIQTQNMAGVFNMALADPELRDMTRIADAYRALLKVLKVPQDEWILSDEELAEKAAKRAAEPQQPDIETQKLMLQREIAEMDREVKITVAQLQRETEMAKAVQTSNVKMEELEAMMERVRAETASKERIVATEIAVAEATGQHAGGTI